MTYRIGVGSLAPVTLVSVLEHPIDDSVTAKISKFFIFLTCQRLPGFILYLLELIWLREQPLSVPSSAVSLIRPDELEQVLIALESEHILQRSFVLDRSCPGARAAYVASIQRPSSELTLVGPAEKRGQTQPNYLE